MFRRCAPLRASSSWSGGWVLAVVVAVAVAGALPACKSDGRSGGPAVSPGTKPAPAAAPATVVVDTGERRITFHVELALTPAEHERGLMYRERLPAEAGMLFVSDRDEIRTFWMKNTLIPLDIIFIDREHRIVGIAANAEPQTLSPRRVGAPSRYVLEIGGGLAAELGIRAGQRLELHGVPAEP